MTTYLEKDNSSERAHELSNISLRHYLVNNTDVRSCPRQECGYAGLVEVDRDTEIIECTTSLECLKCGAKWMDPLQGTT